MARKSTRSASLATVAHAAFTLTRVDVTPVFPGRTDPGAPRAVRLFGGKPVVVGQGKLWPIERANGAVVHVGAAVAEAGDVSVTAPAAKMADLVRLGFARAKEAPAAPAAAPASAPVAAPSGPVDLTAIAKAMREAGFDAASVAAALIAKAG